MFYQYSIIFWNDTTNVPEEDSGIVWATDIPQAYEQVQKDYGEELMAFYVAPIYTEGVTTMSFEELQAIQPFSLIPTEERYQ